MAQKQVFCILAKRISKEIRNTVSIHKYSSTEYYNFAVLSTSDPLQLYAKIKLSKAMRNFERLHNANCVLNKQKDKFVICINY